MVPLKSPQRRNSDLDRAAGQEEFRHFILLSDQNSVAISPLSPQAHTWLCFGEAVGQEQ